MIIPFSTLMGDTCDLGVLLCNALGGIDQKNNDICALYGRYCTDDAVPLQLLFDLVFLSKACGIDENIFISIVHDRGIDRIARRSGDVGYDDTVRAQQFVDQGGFSDVRFSTMAMRGISLSSSFSISGSKYPVTSSSISPMPSFPDAEMACGSPMPRL